MVASRTRGVPQSTGDEHCSLLVSCPGRAVKILRVYGCTQGATTKTRGRGGGGYSRTNVASRPGRTSSWGLRLFFCGELAPCGHHYIHIAPLRARAMSALNRFEKHRVSVWRKPGDLHYNTLSSESLYCRRLCQTPHCCYRITHGDAHSRCNILMSLTSAGHIINEFVS